MAEEILIGGVPFRESGWAVVLAGGSASGKSTIIRDGRLKFEGEVLSTDSFGEEMIDVHNNAKYYEEHDPARLAAAEKLVQKGRIGHWDITGEPNIKLDFECPCFPAGKYSTILSNGAHIQKKSHFKKRILEGARNGHANLILDMTGKEEEMKLYTELLHANGYKVALVWVLTNMSLALLWNHRRLRSMKPKAVHIGHHGPKKYLLDALQDERSSWFDDAWLVFNGTESWNRPMTDAEKAEALLRLDRGERGFVVSDSLKERVVSVLGPYAESNYYTVPSMEKQFLRYRMMQATAKHAGVACPSFESVFPSFELKDRDEAEANIRAFYDAISMKEPELPKQPDLAFDVVEPVRAMYKTDEEYREALDYYPVQKERYAKALAEWKEYNAKFE